jgi:hypothetical protein
MNKVRFQSHTPSLDIVPPLANCVALVTWKRLISGGLLSTIGYILSPLSWWNDLFVNIPLALGFAWMVSAFYKPAFNVSLIVGYWLTNIIGLLLMHKGVKQLLSGEAKAATRRELVRDILISLLYTALIVVLLKLKIFAPMEEYFHKG